MQLDAEQRHTQALLAEAERVRERLERILAGIKDDLVMYDLDWRYVYVNDRAAQTLGYPKEQLLGQRIWDLFPDAVGNLFYQKVHQAVAEQQEITFEHYYAPFNKWFENRAYPIEAGLLLFSSDITERKQIEERLRRLQEVTSSFAEAQTLEQVRQIILNEVLSAIGANRCGLHLVTERALVLEEQLLRTHLNEESLHRAAYVPLQVPHPAADSVRRGAAVFIRDREELLQRYPNLAEEVIQDIIQANAHLPLKRGEEVFAVLSLGFSEAHAWDEAEQDFALALADRAAVSYERARLFEAERRARQTAEERAKRISMLQEVATALSQALTPAQVAEVIVRASMTLLESPTGAVHFLSGDGSSLELAYASGYPDEVMASVGLIPLSVNIPATIAVMEGQPMWFESREALVSQYPQLMALRPSHYEASAVVPLLAEGRRLGLLSFSFLEARRFTTEQQDLMLIMAQQCAQALERARLYEETQQLNTQLEQRVAQRTAELERSLKELDQFTYIASHDLKAPLRGVKQLATWIIEDAGELLPEKSQIHLAKMLGRIERMEGLLDNLLMYSRIGRNYYGNRERVDTGALVKEIVEMLAPPPAFAVIIQEEMPALTSLQIPLELIFKNLIENAIKHHHRREGRIEVSARELDDVIEFSVKDDGPGIDGRFHERIFQIFQTLQPQEESESSGVGLSIVKKAVESQGGRLTLVSAEGEGATFQFTWPKS